jgi:hypothetical protein
MPGPTLKETMMFLSRLQMCAILMFAAANLAHADSITTYSLSGNLDNGGIAITAAGQFQYDTTTNTITSWDLTIYGPANAPFCAGAPTSTCYVFTNGGGANASFAADLFTFTSPNMGGNIDELIVAPNYTGPAPLPDGSYILDSNSYLKTITPGGTGQALFTSGSLVAITPEPETLLLFIAPLVILGMRQRLHCARCK